jgi:hypothetical protein
MFIVNNLKTQKIDQSCLKNYTEIIMHRITDKFIIIFAVLFLLSCSSKEESITVEQATIDYDLIYSMPKQPVDYETQVRPILETRCIACHGCYDAPCQLKLSSMAGVARGANKDKVYNGARITADEPTRMFVDAITTEQWRDKKFYPVLNESPRQNPVANLENSVLYQMLRLKQMHPQARAGMLDDAFDIGLDREQSCPTIDEFEDYKAEHPKGGMPYALPNIDRDEYETLVHWIAQGSPMTDDLAPSKAAASQIKRWEAFLNGSSNKERLVSRYIYEHLFQAHLHFSGTDDREFYRMVRSSTAPGDPVEIIATRNPYSDPSGAVYYRIVRHQASIVAKSHLVYELSPSRMQRYRELFYEPDYEVASLPSYDITLASNPIKTFAALPVKSRYKFLLDEARFYIEGFIKGPVCRGQVALNVIEDQFWLVFFDPDAEILSLDDEFLNATADYLATPAELGDNFKLFTVPSYYKSLFQKYAKMKAAARSDIKPVKLDDAMKYIWDGDGKNPNAALTVFRHLDSASVNYGFVGDYPDTSWILDYSILERIHYLLVAGYDVYGNLGHQLNTRLYMDFLRTEAEDYFLAFLPPDKRKQVRDSWYQGIRESNKDDSTKDVDWLGKEYVKGYQTNDVKLELFQNLEQYLGVIAGDGDYINRCQSDRCKPNVNKGILRADKAMQHVSRMNGYIVEFLPDIAFLRVRMGGKPVDDQAYTLISNKAYKSVSSMFEGETLGDRRDFKYDTQTAVRWLEGTYPNFFYSVALNDIEAFVDEYNAIENRQEYEVFVARFGIRRTSERFWEHADWFNDHYAASQPITSGIFDLNRYQNR